MKRVGIIPARMAATRFPGKPLKKINGIPMIGHVYFRSKLSVMLDEVYIATCDRDIQEYANLIGAGCVMTKNSHERCTDRTVEAMLKLEESEGKFESVVMIQGDEPMILPEMIDAFYLGNKQLSGQIVNLICPLKDEYEFEDPNYVKVVKSLAGDALYFSREPIPSRKKHIGPMPIYRQLGIIAFKRDFLVQYAQMEQTPLEKIESVDMLRVLENGYAVKTCCTEKSIYSVDTIDQLRSVELLMKSDTLQQQYCKIGMLS